MTTREKRHGRRRARRMIAGGAAVVGLAIAGAAFSAPSANAASPTKVSGQSAEARGSTVQRMGIRW